MKPNDYPYTNGHSSGYQSPGNPSSDLATVPRSLRNHLEQVQHLMSHGMHAEANSVLNAAEAELARTRPELLALIYCARHGYRGFSVTHTQVKYTQQVLEKRFLGIVVGREVLPITTMRSTTKTFRLI